MSATKSNRRASTRARAARQDQPVREVEHGQRRSHVVEELLADVFQGRFQAGQRLVIQNLAERFGMSQTPIREALVTLEGIGIIDNSPNCGAVVRRVTANDVREVCQVREALECSAVQSACGRIDLGTLHELSSAVKKGAQTPVPKKPTAAVRKKAVAMAQRLDSQIHNLIAASCGNRFLSKELNRLELLFRGFRDVSWDRHSTSDLHRLAEEAREHLAIVDALIAGDGPAAAAAMRKHIQSGRRYWSRGLEKQETAS